MVYRFEGFELDSRVRELRQEGAAIDLEPQVFDLLLYLLDNAEHVVSKDELFEHVWAGRIVSDSTLSSRINAARRAIGDDGNQQRLIRTMPRRGFRFVGRLDQGSENQVGDAAVSTGPGIAPLGDTQGQGPQPRVAVLPFKNLGGDSDGGAVVADGFREDLTTALSQLDNLTIAHIAQDDERNAKRASHFVVGSIRVAGDRVRLNVQLIDAETDNHLWADKFDGSLGRVFEFLDDIVEKVVIALEVRLSDGEQVRTWREEARNAGAYEHFIKGRAAYKEYSRAGNARAQSHYQTALDKSPNFISAMIGLARTHIGDATFGWSARRSASIDEARRLISAALDIATNHAPAHLELAHLLMLEGDFAAARREAARSIDIDPNSGEAYCVMAYVFGCLDLHEDAIRAGNRSVQLTPSVPEYYLIPIADAYIALSRYDEALSVLRRIEARRPDWIMTCVLSAILEICLGRPANARAYVEKILKGNPHFTAEKWRNMIFYPNRKDVPGLVDKLVSAGLPES